MLASIRSNLPNIMNITVSPIDLVRVVTVIVHLDVWFDFRFCMVSAGICWISFYIDPFLRFEFFGLGADYII
jgi:hypothetical protein